MAMRCALLLFILAATVAPARAQTAPDRATGMVTARSYEVLAPGAAIAVRPASDTDQYQRLKTTIEESLRARGFQVADNSRLVLEFYSTEVTGGPIIERPSGGRADKSSVPGQAQAPSMGVLTGLNQSLFGEQPQRGAGGGGETAAPREVHVSMTLTDQPAARRVWQGSASGEVRRADLFAATQSLVPFLVDRIGTTVGAERFDLP
jgi:hypothetical protein